MAESRSPLSIRRSFTRTTSPDRPVHRGHRPPAGLSDCLLPRLALAVLVLFWSVSPLLPLVGVGAGAGPFSLGSGRADTVQALPAGSVSLHSRADTASRILNARPISGPGSDDEPDTGSTDPDHCGYALARAPQVPAPAMRTGFVTPQRSGTMRARRTLRRSGRAPPVALRSA